jgi:hypothetical protein
MPRPAHIDSSFVPSTLAATTTVLVAEVTVISGRSPKSCVNVTRKTSFGLVSHACVFPVGYETVTEPMVVKALSAF